MKSERVEKIRQQWASAKPKPSNPAWMNSHHDIGVLLDEYDHLSAALDDAIARRMGYFDERYCECEYPMIKCDHLGCRCTQCGKPQQLNLGQAKRTA